jgi:hypothetical protein
VSREEEFASAPTDDGLDPLDDWQRFTAQVRARLETGRREYGDESFNKDPRELLDELGQEAMDLAGWGYILWHRVNALRERIAVPKS